jgi:hypothetical protein
MEGDQWQCEIHENIYLPAPFSFHFFSLEDSIFLQSHVRSGFSCTEIRFMIIDGVLCEQTKSND